MGRCTQYYGVLLPVVNFVFSPDRSVPQNCVNFKLACPNNFVPRFTWLWHPLTGQMHLNRSGKIFLFIYCRMQEAVHSKKLMQSGSFPIWMLLSPNTLCWAPLLPTPALICSNKGIKMACILRVDTSVESQIAKKAWLII